LVAGLDLRRSSTSLSCGGPEEAGVVGRDKHGHGAKNLFDIIERAQIRVNEICDGRSSSG
jgi:hypothetical protein